MTPGQFNERVDAYNWQQREKIRMMALHVAPLMSALTGEEIAASEIYDIEEEDGEESWREDVEEIGKIIGDD